MTTLDSENTAATPIRPNRPQSEPERFFMCSPDLLATATLKDICWRRVNPAFTRILGWTESDLLANPCLDLAHPDDLDRTRQAMAELAEGAPLTQFENRVRCKNGAYLWIAWEIWSDRAEGLLCGTGRNVSERKRAEEKLRENEARYRALFNNMTEAFALGEVIFNKQGEPADFRLLEVNAAFIHQTGLGEEVLNRPITESLPGIERHWIQTYGRVVSTGKPATFENYNENTRRYYQVYAYSPGKGRFAILFRDITEEKRAEQALRESETLYRSLAANLPNGGAFVVDHSLRYLLAEGEALGQAGFQSADFEGKTIAEVLDPETAFLYEKHYRQALSGKPFSWEHDNHGRRYITRGVPLRDDSDRVFAALAVSYDITDRKTAEDQLKTTLESIGDGFIACDRDWRLIYVNTPAEKMLDLPRSELIERRLWDLFAPSLGTRLEDEFRRAAAGEIREFESLYEPWGRWFQNRCFPRDGGGIAVYFKDITENKRMEAALHGEQELFQTVFKSVPVMLTVYDPQLNMVHINPFLYDITGWTEADVREHGIMKLVYPDPDYRRWVAEYMQSLAPGFTDIRMACKDGRALETAWANTRISDGRQVGIGIDMTERKELEESLRRLNKTLEKQVAERTALAEARAEQLGLLTEELIEAEERERKRIAELLHDDLQQILTGARMQLQTVFRRMDKPRALEPILQLMKESIRKTRHLSHELSPVTVHQSGLAEALEWLVRKMDEQFGLEVRLETDPTQKVENTSLKIFLYRAAHELLFNTVKHAGVNTAEVALFQADGFLTLTVGDQGDGFDPLSLDSSDTHTGLGLISLRERTRFFGGRFEIDSAPGKGCRFTLRIPENPASSKGP